MPTSVDPRYHRADGARHDPGDLVIAQTFHIGEVHGMTQFGGLTLERRNGLGVAAGFQDLRLGRAGT